MLSWNPKRKAKSSVLTILSFNSKNICIYDPFEESLDTEYNSCMLL